MFEMRKRKSFICLPRPLSLFLGSSLFLSFLFSHSFQKKTFKCETKNIKVFNKNQIAINLIYDQILSIMTRLFMHFVGYSVGLSRLSLTTYAITSPIQSSSQIQNVCITAYKNIIFYGYRFPVIGLYASFCDKGFPLFSWYKVGNGLMGEWNCLRSEFIRFFRFLCLIVYESATDFNSGLITIGPPASNCNVLITNNVRLYISFFCFINIR